MSVNLGAIMGHKQTTKGGKDHKMHTIKIWMKDTAIFCKQNQFLCTAIFLLVYLLHGKHAFTTNSLFDTDDVIYFKDSTLNWLECAGADERREDSIR